jgi:hypothetical protein
MREGKFASDEQIAAILRKARTGLHPVPKTPS